MGTVEATKMFGGVKAVDALSICIPRGRMTCVVGPNGSGKSTLVHLLSGVLPLDGGAVMVDGVTLTTMRAREARGHSIGRTFQEVRLFDQISVWDNIMVVLTRRDVFAALLERSGAQHSREAREILEGVGLWEKRRSLPMNLSYGQRKLLEIGRAMALEAKTYLFDEPFAGLFPQTLERVKRIMKHLRERGRTIVFVSHNMDIVRELADHLMVLDSGKLLLEGQVEEVLADPVVLRAYMGL